MGSWVQILPELISGHFFQLLLLCVLLLITSITTQKARVCTSTSWRLLQLRELGIVLLAFQLLNIYLFLAPTIYSR